MLIKSGESCGTSWDHDPRHSANDTEPLACVLSLRCLPCLLSAVCPSIDRYMCCASFLRLISVSRLSRTTTTAVHPAPAEGTRIVGSREPEDLQNTLSLPRFTCSWLGKLLLELLS